MTVVEGYRTRVRVGQAAEYSRIHARLPEAIGQALRECGLIDWRIWIDGETLFHAIETRDGREAMSQRMASRTPIDPGWSALIDSLVDDAPDSRTPLSLVWRLEPEGAAGHDPARLERREDQS